MPAPRKYPLELRERAVRMYRASEPKPMIRRMAEELGVHHEALRNRIRQAEADAGERGDMLTTAEREELAALRKENAQLKRANGRCHVVGCPGTHREVGLRQSCGRTGSCFDVAAESFRTLLEGETGTRIRSDRATARAEVLDFIEIFYNRRLRKHKIFGCLTPAGTR
ncbi:transposase [Streptomyces sp. NPDC014986]|uniref:transposase n=1 Tax=Streptomyces sp. NPDC014986 TaxID=3364934 RepID=UPI0036FE887F